MKKLLIVVDYQNDFVSGSLGFEKAKTLEGGICNKIDSFKKSGGDILFTLDTHNPDYLDTHEGRYLPVAHCVDGSNGHKLYGRVYEKSEGEKLIRKASFGSDTLFGFLKDNPYDEIEFVGVVTNICVISNAIVAQTALPEASIVIDASLCGSNDEVLHKKALDIMRNLHMEIVND